MKGKKANNSIGFSIKGKYDLLFQTPSKLETTEVKGKEKK